MTTHADYTPEFCKKLLRDLNVTIYGQDEKKQIHGYSHKLEYKFILKRKQCIYDLILTCGGEIVDKYIVRPKQKKTNGKYTVRQVNDVFRLEAEKNQTIETVKINIDQKTMIEMLKVPDQSVKETIGWMWIFDPDLYYEKFGDVRVEDAQRAMIKARKKLRKALK